MDERIAAHKPASLDFASAAALPLTAITAWEMLFDRLCVREEGNEGDVLLIVGAAGGVGSILTQLARKLTRLTVIGTASRPQSQQWVSELGAHHVIDHSKPLTEELARIGIKQVSHVASLNNTEQHYQQLINALQPQGKLALIDDPQSLDAVPLKVKAFLCTGNLCLPAPCSGPPISRSNTVYWRVSPHLLMMGLSKPRWENTSAPSTHKICVKRTSCLKRTVR